MPRFLNFGDVSDVNAGADEAEKEAGVRESRDAMIQQPTILTVGALQAVLHTERGSLLKIGAINLKTAIEVLPVNTLCPSVADLLLHGSATELQPRLIEPCAERVCTGKPD